jgi:sortase B
MREKKATKYILGLIIVGFAAVFCVSAYMLIDHYLTGKKAEDAYREIRAAIPSGDAPAAEDDSMQRALGKLREQNNDLVGWLNVFDTGIDYPVVQTPANPEYYLRRDFGGEYSLAGTPFASAISDIARPSDVTIIFGHNMKNGTMFGPLSKYEKETFYNGHRSLRFDTLEERRLYQVTNVLKVSYEDYAGADAEFAYQNYADFADEADFNEFMRKADERSLYDTGVSAEYGDEFILLSTCEYSREDGRLVILAKRVEEVVE